MKFTLVAAAMIGSTNAWFGTGHLLVSRIAYDILSAKGSKNLAIVEEHLKDLSTSITRKHERDHQFVECATYADDFKYHGGIYQKTWHFIDQPYFDQGGSLATFPKFKPDVHDNVEALNGLIAWMNDPSASNYPVTETKSQTPGGDKMAYSTALRLIIHYVGDIHQPLHSTSRVNNDYPAGDRGGNSVYLPRYDGISNLHASWDSVEYEFSGYAKLPFSSSGWSTNGARAADLVARHPLSSIKADPTNINPQQFADDAFAISKSFVYNGVKSGQRLSTEYIKAGNLLAEEQIVLAGNRLANLIESLKLSGPSEEKAETYLF